MDKFRNKLEEWYGNDNLKEQKVEILHTYETAVDGIRQLITVIFMLKKDNMVEIARIFSLGEGMEISIDCQADVNSLQGIKKLIQYGGNFHKWEIE